MRRILNPTSPLFPMAIIVLVFFPLILVTLAIGCNQNSISHQILKVEGNLVSVDVRPGGSTAFIHAMLEFEDGRVQSCRMEYDDPKMFHLNSYNMIEMDSTGTIQNVTNVLEEETDE